MKTSRKLLIAAVAYAMVGVGRGLYVSAKFPDEASQRGPGWWLSEVGLWPYYMIVG